MNLWYHKVDDYRWLTGSIRRDLEPDERSVWADLLALAGLTREPRRGYIERSKGVPYEPHYLTVFLNISEELLNRTIQKCVKEGRLKVFEDGTMLITNWNNYNGLEDWHKKKKQEAERKEARKVSIDKARKTRKTNDNNAKATTRAMNELNSTIKQLKSEIKQPKYVDKNTGEVLE